MQQPWSILRGSSGHPPPAPHVPEVTAPPTPVTFQGHRLEEAKLLQHLDEEDQDHQHCNHLKAFQVHGGGVSWPLTPPPLPTTVLEPPHPSTSHPQGPGPASLAGVWLSPPTQGQLPSAMGERGVSTGLWQEALGGTAESPGRAGPCLRVRVERGQGEGGVGGGGDGGVGGGKKACPPIPMTPPPSICLMQLLRKRATVIKRHSVPRGGHGEGQDAGHWQNIQDGDDSDLSSVPQTCVCPTGTNLAKHLSISLLKSVWGNNSICPISEQADGSTCFAGNTKGRWGAGQGEQAGSRGCDVGLPRHCQTPKWCSNGRRGGEAGARDPAKVTHKLETENLCICASSTHPHTANRAKCSSSLTAFQPLSGSLITNTGISGGAGTCGHCLSPGLSTPWGLPHRFPQGCHRHCPSPGRQFP